MKITVLNGSPKGKYSITLQYVNLISKLFPQHNFKIYHIAQNIKRIEKDKKVFQEILDSVKSSDAVIWSFGLFVLAVSAQLMRFIELIHEKRKTGAFKLVSRCTSQPSLVSVSKVSCRNSEALLMRQQGGPSAATHAGTRASTSSATARSPLSAPATPPDDRIWSTSSSASVSELR